MNKTATAQPDKTAGFLPSNRGVLQHKCACGNHTIAGSECADCARKKMGLQRKLTIGASNDPLEQEADRIADQVMASPSHGTVSGAPVKVQRFTESPSGQTAEVPASVERVLASPGRPLEPALRQDMEGRFGYDFSRVRVHTGSAAERSAREVNANAYTVGNSVVFGAGQFAPRAYEGRRLIAHELTHVVQQDRRYSGLIQRFINCEMAEICPQRITGEENRSSADPIRIGAVSDSTGGTLIWNFAIGHSEPKSNLFADSTWIRYLSQMNAHPEIRWEILGFTDCQGTEATNVLLRLNRARAIQDILPTVVRSRVTSVVGASIGDCFTTNDTERNRALNRSVLIRQVEEEHNFPEERLTVERPRFICGPDVTQAIENTITHTQAEFTRWTPDERTNACDSLDSFLTGAFAWDIVELHNQSWILVYRRLNCATEGAEPACGSSVRVGDDCYYAGSVNYVIFGAMCRLCHSHFSSIASPARMARFTRSAMLRLIDLYKGHGFLGFATPSSNFIPSQQWAESGYRGWRSGASQPPGDRANCRPVCPAPPVRRSFDVNWYPHIPI